MSFLTYGNTRNWKACKIYQAILIYNMNRQNILYSALLCSGIDSINHCIPWFTPFSSIFQLIYKNNTNRVFNGNVYRLGLLTVNWQSHLTRSLNSTAMEQQEVTHWSLWKKEHRLIWDTTFSQNELSIIGTILIIKQWRLDQSISSKGIWKDSDSQKR